MSKKSEKALDLQSLTGKRQGPYNSFNAVSAAQIWQWCSAIGDKSPLYWDDKYRSAAGFDCAVAPPAMMQMWTMRDVNHEQAPGSTDAPPYEVYDYLISQGVLGNVAVSYDVTFHRLLREGDRAKHYTTVVSISDLKTTALGKGYFFTERVEFLDQNDALFAEASITYFHYTPAPSSTDAQATAPNRTASASADLPEESRWQTDFTDKTFTQLREGEALPELVIPITHKLIVSCAIATQDYIDVHHNAPAAQAAGMPDIFMNILSTSGLCARYISDWAGPGSRLRKLNLKLLAPNTPGDTMVMQGRVAALEKTENEALATVEFAGKNNLGYHVTGAATVALAQ